MRLVFKDDAGRERTMKDLQEGSGKLNVELVSGEAVLPEATRLHQEARAAGTRGDYDRALELLNRAHVLAPNWPYPLYDAAFTRLLQGDSAAAEALYAQVDRLAPRGFFTCKTSLDCLRREREGSIPPGFCKAFAALEWVDDPATKKVALEGIVAKYPAFPPAWQQLAGLLEDDDARLHAIANGLNGNPDAETKGMLLLNRAGVLQRRGDTEGATRIFDELAGNPDFTIATEKLAKASLAQTAGK